MERNTLYTGSSLLVACAFFVAACVSHDPEIRPAVDPQTDLAPMDAYVNEGLDRTGAVPPPVVDKAADADAVQPVDKNPESDASHKNKHTPGAPSATVAPLAPPVPKR